MAGLQRHPSLRFSVFELAADIGLEAHTFDGNFDAIVEEDEHQVCTGLSTLCFSTKKCLQWYPLGSLQTSSKQRRTHSSDELTDPPYPLTPPSSNIVRSHSTLGHIFDRTGDRLTMSCFSLLGPLLPATTSSGQQKIR
jgi:hypothetical protein